MPKCLSAVSAQVFNCLSALTTQVPECHRCPSARVSLVLKCLSASSAQVHEYHSNILVAKCPDTLQVCKYSLSSQVPECILRALRVLKGTLGWHWFKHWVKNIALKCLLSNNHNVFANSVICFTFCLYNIFQGRKKYVKIFLYTNFILRFSNLKISWILKYLRVLTDVMSHFSKKFLSKIVFS